MSEAATAAPGATPTVEDLQRKIIELQEHNRDLQHEAKGHRLKAKEYRTKFEELEKARPASEPSAELEALRKENRTLKHRGVFERVARESKAKTTGKALDTLWAAIAYDHDGDADPEDIKGRIEAVRPDYDFLFEPAGDGANVDTAPDPGPTPKPAPATPPARPGPGVGRGAPADGAGKLVVRRSDLQSFRPDLNPFMDKNRAPQFERAKRDGNLVILDE